MALRGPRANHEKAANYHLRSFKGSVGRGLQALRDGDCPGAFSELGAAQLYKGEYYAALAAATGTPPGEIPRGAGVATIDGARLEVGVARHCLIDRRRKGAPRLRLVR